MNYANHNLRTSIQEWKNRLYKAPHNQFGNQLKYIFKNFDSNLQINGILKEITHKYPLSKEEFDRLIQSRRDIYDQEFENEIHQAAFTYQFLKHFIEWKNTYDLQEYMFFHFGDGDETTNGIIENYITPITNVLHDYLDKSNSVLYLLEKYKRRTEWFTKEKLFSDYDTATKNYEQILEDDLRLFLFDQGIDYPFSTPSSASGRADIIGEIETDDPLIIEIKIFDRQKSYGKDRIKEGFTQIVKYANDYNKDVGYLVIFNMDEAELNFNLEENNMIFPPRLTFNNKVFYVVVINAGFHQSASKRGKTQQIEILENELTAK
tara:strand:- start:4554 stop:5513 length:960 start_codon:yes stop_codon:yes gene_type:complete